MLVPLYKVTILNSELGLITFKPYATKSFSLEEFLSRQIAGTLIAADLVPSFEEVPDWSVPSNVDVVRG